jgi:hypothetical protein
VAFKKDGGIGQIGAGTQRALRAKREIADPAWRFKNLGCGRVSRG